MSAVKICSLLSLIPKPYFRPHIVKAILRYFSVCSNYPFSFSLYHPLASTSLLGYLKCLTIGLWKLLHNYILKVLVINLNASKY